MILGGLKAAGLAAILLLTPLAARAQTEPSSFDWTGVYVGGHAGWTWGDFHYVEPSDPAFAFDAEADGISGGLHAGYNHQIDRFVLGLEVDGGVADVSFGSKDSGGNGYAKMGLDASARLRARAGLAVDRTLLFLAGGLAVGRIAVDDTDPDFGKDDATHLGWTVGGGVEHVVTDALVLRLEYLYDDFGTESYDIAAPAGPFFPSYGAETELTAHTVRAAVSYRF